MAKHKNGKALIPIGFEVPSIASELAKTNDSNVEPKAFAYRGVVHRVYPENVGMHYANHIIAQVAEHEYILSFFEMAPPQIEESFDEKADDKIIAKCVTRVIIPKTLMKRLHEVIGRVVAMDKPNPEPKDSDRKAAQ